MRKQDETMPTADDGPVERGVGRPMPERADDGGHDLGVHWIGGKPYMLRWAPPAPKRAGKRSKAK